MSPSLELHEGTCDKKQGILSFPLQRKQISFCVVK
jgi:hypothetical protein